MSDAEVLIERHGALGRIRLNRPKALNSLTLGMVRAIAPATDAFAADSTIAAVILTGEGDRALCAGGDIRALYERGREGDFAFGATFWREEYRVNATIAHYPKPWIAVMDGITMGGGVGLSAHGSLRVVTERTRLAMPETGIGFLPDVGGSWLLSRRDDGFGTYMALTGTPLGGMEAIAAGLADCFVPSARLGEMIEAFGVLQPGADAAEAHAIVRRFAEPVEQTTLQAEIAGIAPALAHDRVETILSALEADGSAFALKTRDIIRTKSPTSLKIALRLLRLGRDSRTLEDCLEREWPAACRILRGHDFYEGVRAAVIEKGRVAQWSPASLEAVSDHAVDAFWAPSDERVFEPTNASPPEIKAIG